MSALFTAFPDRSHEKSEVSISLWALRFSYKTLACAVVFMILNLKLNWGANSKMTLVANIYIQKSDKTSYFIFYSGYFNLSSWLLKSNCFILNKKQIFQTTFLAIKNDFILKRVTFAINITSLINLLMIYQCTWYENHFPRPVGHVPLTLQTNAWTIFFLRRQLPVTCAVLVKNHNFSCLLTGI